MCAPLQQKSYHTDTLMARAVINTRVCDPSQTEVYATEQQAGPKAAPRGSEVHAV